MELHKVSPAFRHSDDIETIQRLQVKNRVLVKEISALKKHIENIITEKDNCAIEWVKCRERERELNHVVDHMVRESGKQIERERVLVEALESMIVVCKEPQSYDFVKVIEIIRAALAAKEAHCPKCGNAGWVWGYELDDPDNDTATDTMTRYTCDWCRKVKAALAAKEG